MLQLLSALNYYCDNDPDAHWKNSWELFGEWIFVGRCAFAAWLWVGCLPFLVCLGVLVGLLGVCVPSMLSITGVSELPWSG